MKQLMRAGLVCFVAAMLSGCGAVMVTNAVVGTTVTAGKIVTKTAVGAGTLAVKGTGAAVRGTGRVVKAVTPG